MTSLAPKTALALYLDWYRAMGVDGATGAAAIDWMGRGDAGPGTGFRLADGTAPTTPPPQVPAAPSAGTTAAAPRRAQGAAVGPASPGESEARAAARAAAAGARSLEELRLALERFDGCGLKATAKNLCLYRGAARAPVMIIGEAPGRDEDLAGKPFVGRAGQLLDRMLAAIGLGEESVHITNVVYWRPPGNRTPTTAEAEACRPFLERQIGLVEPRIIVLLGGVAAKHVLNTSAGILQLRGEMRSMDIANKRFPALASLHPAYLLRTPAQKRLAWRDLLELAAFLRS